MSIIETKTYRLEFAPSFSLSDIWPGYDTTELVKRIEDKLQSMVANHTPSHPGTPKEHALQEFLDRAMLSAAGLDRPAPKIHPVTNKENQS
tara:strand:+ start:506 stop:778 length:273 start_codon:yes stop_codon:yes gene_type:complete